MTDAHSFVHLLLVVAAVLFTTRVLSVLAEKFGQPAILGELLGGVVLGASVLGILDPADFGIHILAQLGLLILLFEIGLATDLRALTRVGGTATVVAVVGVILPFVFGYAALSALGVGRLAAVVCAAALTATSIGVSTRVLAELGFLQTVEGQVVLGTAVLDDIIGLVILSIIGSFVAGDVITASGVARTSAVAFGFVAIAIIVGSFVVPPLFHAAKRLRSPTTIAVMGLAFAFSLAALAGLLGSAIIVGGFVAGVLLNRIDQRDDVQRSAGAMGSLLTPIFFASVGASVDLRALAEPRTLLITLVLLVTGAAGKLIAAYVPVWFKGNKALIGTAILPRGEVELIVAQTGLAIGALDAALFGAITLMVLLTTLLSPPLIQGVAKRDPRARELMLARDPGNASPDLTSGLRGFRLNVMSAEIHIGTQGWNYDAWVGPFYPTGTRPSDFLTVYARAFDSVEVDSTFYASPATTTIRSWVDRTPKGFVFALKMPQEITHEHRLRDETGASEAFFERARELGDKLGPVLVQMGPDFQPGELPALVDFIGRAPADLRIAMEFRHRGWITDGVLALLSEHNIALALIDGRWIPRKLMLGLAERPTADFAYIRWMGPNRDLVDYSRVQVDRSREVDAWSDAVESLSEKVSHIYGYVANHFSGHSPATAREFQSRLGQTPVDPDLLGEQMSLF